MGQTAQLPALSDAAGDGPANPRNAERGTPEPGTDWQSLESEEHFGVPQGAGQFFRIEAESGRSFAVWAPTETVAQAAAERIDGMTTATGRETFRVAAIPVRRKDRLLDDGGIAKVREIKS